MNTKQSLHGLLILLIALGVQGAALAKDDAGNGSIQKGAIENSKLNKGEMLEGKVVDVADGDTLTLLVDKTQYNIRLLGIDAPEEKQPFGEQSKKALSKKVLHQQVHITSFGQDKNGHTLGIVKIGERNINAEMVKEGFAWHYKEHLDSNSLAKYEDEARKAKIGLWADENPTPPWQWHRQTIAEDPFETKPTDPSPTNASTTQAEQPKTYWLTASSNTRHNSKCRYYQKTKGRPCGPDEGKACKLCGG